MAHQYDTDDHEQRLIAETRAQFSILTRAILAGEPTATKRITDALGDYLTDHHAMAEVVRGALVHSDALLPVLTNLIWAEAGELAEFEVEQMKVTFAELRADDRIAAALADRAEA